MVRFFILYKHILIEVFEVLVRPNVAFYSRLGPKSTLNSSEHFIEVL